VVRLDSGSRLGYYPACVHSGEMGAAMAAPLAAVGSCLGTCCAAGCCQLAQSGSVDTMKGARCLLLWLQMLFLTMAASLMVGEHTWLDTPCEQWANWMDGQPGVCECANAADITKCRQDQLVLRACCAAVAIFLFQFLLTISGCASSAALGLPVLKFMALPLLWVIFLFVPNQVFTSFGLVASLIGAGFYVAQIILLADFTWRWNESWFELSNQAKRREPGSKKYLSWLIGILIFSILFLVGGIALGVMLFMHYQDQSKRAIILASLILSLVLLVVSITEWCKHGTFLVSAAIVLFGQWVVWQTVPMSGDANSWDPPIWAEFGWGVFSLIVLLMYNAGGTDTTPAAAVELVPKPEAAAVEAGAASTAIVVTVDGPEVKVDAWDFGVQCLVQTTAAAYLTSIFAPVTGFTPFVVHNIALFLSLALYGWMLVAPMLLKSRQF